MRAESVQCFFLKKIDAQDCCFQVQWKHTFIETPSAMSPFEKWHVERGLYGTAFTLKLYCQNYITMVCELMFREESGIIRPHSSRVTEAMPTPYLHHHKNVHDGHLDFICNQAFGRHGLEEFSTEAPSIDANTTK